MPDEVVDAVLPLEATPEEVEAGVAEAIEAITTPPPEEDTPIAWDTLLPQDQYVPPQAAPAADYEEPGFLDEIQSKASQGAIVGIQGAMMNQNALRSALGKAGANEETQALAEATLWALNPQVMASPGAARFAAQQAIGAMAMQGKSWKRPPASAPPSAQPVGRPNPSYTAPEVERDTAAFNAAFKDLGISADLLNED